jgi:hypothetical protein
MQPGGTGWTIRILPKVTCDDTGDWAFVVNPPYRYYNSLYLNASYDISAQQAVEINPREFSFVVTCGDYKVERQRLETVLWPYGYSQKEADEALAKLGTSPLGKGKFTILDSKISPAEKAIDGKNFGKIDWLKFRLDITPPAAPGRKSQ